MDSPATYDRKHAMIHQTNMLRDRSPVQEQARAKGVLHRLLGLDDTFLSSLGKVRHWKSLAECLSSNP